MNLTIRQLRAFVLLGQTRQFTQSAQRMHVTQSALSSLIKELEACVGMKLFDRHTRMVELTSAGASFLHTAEKTLVDLEQAVLDLQDLAAVRQGRVRVVASTVISSGLLSPAFKAFRHQHPNVHFVLKDVAEEDILDTVLSGAVDFGIGTSAGPVKDLEELPLFNDSFIALCNTHHPLASRTRLAWRDLQDQPFIALAQNSPIRKLINETVEQAGVRLNIVNEVSFATTVLSLVAADLGVSVLPMNNHPYLPAFDVHSAVLARPVIKRRISAFQPKARSVPPAASAFIEFLQAHIRATRPGTVRQ